LGELFLLILRSFQRFDLQFGGLWVKTTAQQARCWCA